MKCSREKKLAQNNNKTLIKLVLHRFSYSNISDQRGYLTFRSSGPHSIKSYEKMPDFSESKCHFCGGQNLRCWFERVLTYFSFGLLPPSGVAERPLGQGRTHHFHFPAWDAREEPTTTSSSCSTLVSAPCIGPCAAV